MRLLDPARPDFAGKPLLLHPETGKEIGHLPFFNVKWVSEKSLDVWICAIVYGNTARNYVREIEPSELGPLLDRWKEDPEKVMMEFFGWKPENPPAQFTTRSPARSPTRSSTQSASVLDDFASLSFDD